MLEPPRPALLLLPGVILKQFSVLLLWIFVINPLEKALPLRFPLPYSFRAKCGKSDFNSILLPFSRLFCSGCEDIPQSHQITNFMDFYTKDLVSPKLLPYPFSLIPFPLSLFPFPYPLSPIYSIHNPPVASSQSAIRSTACGMSLSEISSSSRGRRDSATSRRISSCSRMKTARSSYWSGLPETLRRSARAAAKESGLRWRNTSRKLSGSRRCSSQPKS